MSFPISIKATHVELLPETSLKVEEKLHTLEKVLAHANVVSCSVEIERRQGHKSGDVFRVEVNIKIDGDVVRAEASKGTIDQAVDVVKNELKRSLRRKKQKEEGMVKRGGAALKRMMRLGR